MYKFTVVVWHDIPDGTSAIYAADSEHELADWSSAEIKSALAAGLIVLSEKPEVSEGVADGESVRAQRAHPARRA